MKQLFLIYLLCFAGFAQGQQAYVQNLKSSDQDIFQRNLYSADKVMDMRNELALTEAQATKIKKIHSENAGKFSTMKWDLDDATAKLKDLLDQSKIDEIAVQKQMDKVLALENSLKKQQLSTMVSIKNELNAEQQQILQATRVITVNGVSISGYAENSTNPSKSFSSTKFSTGYPAGLAQTSSSSPKIAVQVAGTGKSGNPVFYIETKDGMEEVSDLNHINPNDIESMQVLKDKTAVEKFGEKGKNGVVIIKLKEKAKK
ncbi:Spy/CpxP family protein refolding chaperone [Algoriphagus sp. 4150]|uniref:Spy/CpxP family protein refolding chaperone n=1 Tax=Algoriphagus sp. 4150 TaxID=2817756 RepID=UPI0028663EAD|nr:periplasmic heavy metal sensor [Algoriphagus sp. 4150]MDR7131534.1 Spy/CpxP family protein refolding chaperone [Algoriphagus sp. 4150]